MSVIAKMNLTSTPYAQGAKVNLHCVYDTGLAKDENEDVRFTKATPWGQCEFAVPSEFALPENSTQLYMFFTTHLDEPKFDQALFAVKARCVSILDTGYQRQIELAGIQYGEDTPVPEALRICEPSKWPTFNLKMGVDNEAASLQFEVLSTYWVVGFDASKFESMNTAIMVARGA